MQGPLIRTRHSQSILYMFYEQTLFSDYAQYRQ